MVCGLCYFLPVQVSDSISASAALGVKSETQKEHLQKVASALDRMIAQCNATEQAYEKVRYV